MKKSVLSIRLLITVIVLGTLLLLTGCDGLNLSPWTGSVKVTNLTATQGTDPIKITLSWAPVSGAVGYSVHVSHIENGDYEQITWDQATTTMDVYADSEYYGYWYDIEYGRQLWFRVQAMLVFDGGIAYSEMSDATVGWTDPDAYAGSWVTESRSISSDGTTETVDSGYRHDLVINASTNTIEYTYSTYNTGTSVFDAVEGARFTYDGVLFTNSDSATFHLVDVRQTHFLNSGTGDFDPLTTQSYTELTGGVLTGLELHYRLDTEMLEMNFDNSLFFDYNDLGLSTSISSNLIFFQSFATE